MNRIHLVFCFGLICIFNSCTDKAPQPAAQTTDPEPAVVGKAIVSSISPDKNQTLDIFGSITIKFAQPLNKVISLPVGNPSTLINYKPVLEIISVQGAQFKSTWTADSNQVVLKTDDALKPGSNFVIRIVSHWKEKKNNAWQIVNWQNKEVRETIESPFSTVAGKFQIEATNIAYMYPVANQYHFFPKEYPQGFLKLIKGQSYLFTDSGFDTWVEFQNQTAVITQPLSYSSDNYTITYSIPSSLQNETIYTLVLKRKNKATNETSDLYKYSFRTSKFNKFSDKVASFDLSATVFRKLEIPFRVHSLVQDFSSGEYFDDFELGLRNDTLKSYSPALIVPYAANLIQFSIELGGNDWYDNQINPLLFAPWTDPNFKPALSRDTSRVGAKPTRAMYIARGTGGKLTDGQILANNAPPITQGSLPTLSYMVGPFLNQDFNQIQNILANKYTSGAPSREDKVIWGQFPIMTKGIYRFKMRYRLPNGMISSSVSLSMNNPIG